MPAPPLVGGGGCGWQTWQRTRYFDNTTVAPLPCWQLQLPVYPWDTFALRFALVSHLVLSCGPAKLSLRKSIHHEALQLWLDLQYTFDCLCVCVCALGGLSLGQKLIKAKMNPRFKMSVSMPPALSFYIYTRCMYVCVYWCVCVYVKSN